MSVSAHFSAFSLAWWELQRVQQLSLSQWSLKVKFLAALCSLLGLGCRRGLWGALVGRKNDTQHVIFSALCVCKGGTRWHDVTPLSSLFFTQENQAKAIKTYFLANGNLDVDSLLSRLWDVGVNRPSGRGGNSTTAFILRGKSGLSLANTPTDKSATWVWGTNCNAVSTEGNTLFVGCLPRTIS